VRVLMVGWVRQGRLGSQIVLLFTDLTLFTDLEVSTPSISVMNDYIL
jgi:hypothetical protein